MNEKEMNQLENQLRSWHPRRPSPRIKRRLFPSASAREASGLSLRWLAPAAACLMLALTIASQQEPGLSANSARHEAMMGMISSNVNYTNMLRENDAPGRNRISPPSFEWTNLSAITSSISPFSPGRVN
jgi:hypothetical protein